MSNDKLNLIEEIRKDIENFYKNFSWSIAITLLDKIKRLEDLIKQEVQE